MKQTKSKTPAKARTSTKKGAAPKAKPSPKRKPSVVKVANKKPTTQCKRVPAKKRKGNIFEGASEISMTENKIAVTRSVANNSKGGYTESTVRTYHDKSPKNMRALDEVMLRKGVKKITVKLN